MTDPKEGMVPPADFGWVTDLGPLVSVTHASLAGAAIAAPFLAFAAIVSGFLLGGILQALTQFPGDAQTLVFGSIWTIGLAAAGYYLGVRAGRAVALYEGGLAIKEHARVRAWGWDDIAGVSVERKKKALDVPHELEVLRVWLGAMGIAWLIQRLRGQKVHTHTIETTLTIYDRSGGSGVIDPWFRTAAELADRVEDEVELRVTPALRAQFNRGERLDFGAVSISREGGIEIGRQAIPWDGVAEFSVAEEKLTIREREDGAEHTVPLSSLKNARACVDLLRAGVAVSDWRL
jgi:hypothetical protein